MDANGTRFSLLLGEADWGSCYLPHGEKLTPLRDIWQHPAQEMRGYAHAAWDRVHHELTLRPRLEEIVAAPADQPVAIEQRRGAAADRFGNIYWIDESCSKILVRSAGSAKVSDFWHAGMTAGPASHGDFEAQTNTAAAARQFAGVAVTLEHYLVVGCIESRSILIFDLIAGGAPQEMIWPLEKFAPFDMVARPCGGVWILDRTHGCYWGLDRQFGVISADQASVALPAAEGDDFQPLAASGKRQRPAAGFPAGTALAQLHPVAIETLDDDTVLILDHQAGSANSRVFVYRNGNQLGKGGAAISIEVAGHDFIVLPSKEHPASAGRLLVASASGNQTFAFDILLDSEYLELDPANDFYPMRRCAGKALVTSNDQAYYDFGASWVPLMRQKRARYETEVEIVTPVFDSSEPHCVWHRLAVDACIPADSKVEVFSQAGDVKDDTGAISGDWQAEPPLYLRSDGCELPWLRNGYSGGKASRPPAGEGTWELLLQRARGRFLQLKIKLSGDGRSTPRLRALRAWYPRFSYVEHYLPALYREDRESSDFLERWLANFEGFYTALEDKIANVHALFDERSVPVETLAWLGAWFGVALDPAWDERRQRLFIRHALDFFNYRGTVHGLKMALHLAFDPQIDEQDLGTPEVTRSRLNDIRIVENYLQRRATSANLGKFADASGPRLAQDSGPWTPLEGNAGLMRRYANFIGKTHQPEQELLHFSLLPPEQEEAAAKWQVFFQQTLGFLPSASWAESQHWQKYLASHYNGIAALNAQYQTAYAKFADIALPHDDPSQAACQADWHRFMADTAGSLETAERRRFQDFLARRYRRVEELNLRYGSHWPSFGLIPLPDRLPFDGAALIDWYQFEVQVKPMHDAAHRFQVLLPTPASGIGPDQAKVRIDLARRIVDLEKPAHTIFDVLFYWALFRIGEARLGIDTLLDTGSRLPDAVLGQSFIGTSFVGAPPAQSGSGRLALPC